MPFSINSQPQALRQGQRSVIMNYNIQILKDGFSFSGGFDLQHLRSLVLFFDTIEFPNQNIVASDFPADMEYLISIDVLRKTSIRYTGVFSADLGARFLLDARDALFQLLETQNPGAWSIATGANSISDIDGQMAPGRGVLVSLTNAIPVPDVSVPLNDIVEFKESRRDELLSLRRYLEEVYLRIASSADQALAHATEVERLQRSIIDYRRTLSESRWPVRLTDLKAKINLENGIAAGATAYLAGLPLVSALGTGLVASLGGEIAAGWRQRTNVRSPFAYINSFHEDLFHGPSAV